MPRSTAASIGISGEEASAYYAAGTAQYHLNADIMYALRKYVQATGDEQFLREYGAEMLVETARLWLDLDVKDGCHIASMGGTWMTLTYGFGGMHDNDGTLSFWPRRAPEENAILRFAVTYRGQRLEVEIGRDKVEYALRAGECLVIRHETEELRLTRENPVVVRQVGRRVAAS